MTTLCFLWAADADAFGLHDQQVAPNVLLVQRRDPSEEEMGFRPGRRMWGESCNNDSGVGAKGEAEKVRKALIG